MTPAKIEKGKDDWQKAGVSIYYINTNESGFPLYYGKIEKNNGDGTLSINVVCQTRGRSKDPVILTAPANKVHKMKS